MPKRRIHLSLWVKRAGSEGKALNLSVDPCSVTTCEHVHATRRTLGGTGWRKHLGVLLEELEEIARKRGGGV